MHDNNQIKRIQSGRSRAGWDHKAHVEFMQDRFGMQKDSLLKLNQKQLDEYEGHLRKLGHIGYGNGQAGKDPQEKLIHKLWKELGEQGKLREPCDAGLMKFIKAKVGVDHLSFCDKAKKAKLIPMLLKWKNSGQNNDTA